MTTTYQPNAANQYEQIVIGSEIVEPEFDRNGNLLQDDRNTYTWDSDIHLLSVTTKPKAKPETKNPEQSTAFRYDALHRRIARLEPQGKLTLFVMDGWNVIEEHQATFTAQPHGKAAHGATQGSLTRPGKDAKPTLSVRHSWGEDLSGTLQGAGGIGGLLASIHNISPTKIQDPSAASETAAGSPKGEAQRNQQSTTSLALFFHDDSNGNVILLTDERAQPAARYSYDAFGQTITATGPAASINRYRFSTKPIENGSGLAYYGYRYDDPVSGKWLNRDPIAVLLQMRMSFRGDTDGLYLVNLSEREIAGQIADNLEAMSPEARDLFRCLELPEKVFKRR
jgi:RHS repeat-associated protein